MRHAVNIARKLRWALIPVDFSGPVRIVDKKRTTLIYIAIGDKVIEGSPQNALSTVPIMLWTADKK